MQRLLFLPILLSMAAGVLSVKAFAEDLPSANKGLEAHKANPRDGKKDWERLVRAVMISGQDEDFPNGLAQAVGLPSPLPTKRCDMDISDHDGVVDDRTVQVVYTLEDSGDDAAIKRPSCIYLRRGHNTKHDGTLQYFRLDLEGRLEKVVTLKNKIDDDGNALREGRARIEEDPLDPAIQKAFKIERSYWMKDWLKKQSEGIPAGGKEAVSPVTNGTAP